MKLTFFKRLSMAAAMMTVLPLMGHVNNIQAGIVFMNPVPNDNGDWNENGPKRTPQQDLLPLVSYEEDLEELCFVANNTVVFTYEITDASGTLADVRTVSLTAGSTQSFSISTLPDGDYTITLYIGSRVYEGDFTK